MRLTREERETLVWTDESVETWGIHTMSVPMMRKLDKLYEAINVNEDNGEVYGKEYQIPINCVSFRRIKQKKAATPEQLERMRLARQRKSGPGA